MPFVATFPLSVPLDPSSDTATLDHAAAALARLAQYLKTQPNVQALLEGLCAQVQDLEQMFVDMDFYRQIDNGFGEHLDNIGAIVRQPRASLDDSDYKLYLKAKIAANLSSGTVESLYTIARLLVGDSATIGLENQYPAGFEFTVIEEIDPATAAALLAFFRTSRAAGVRGILHWSESAPEDTFTLDGTGDQRMDVGLFSSALV